MWVAEERPGSNARSLGRAFGLGPDHKKHYSRTSFPAPSSLPSQQPCFHNASSDIIIFLHNHCSKYLQKFFFFPSWVIYYVYYIIVHILNWYISGFQRLLRLFLILLSFFFWVPLLNDFHEPVFKFPDSFFCYV